MVVSDLKLNLGDKPKTNALLGAEGGNAMELQNNTGLIDGEEEATSLLHRIPRGQKTDDSVVMDSNHNLSSSPELGLDRSQ